MGIIDLTKKGSQNFINENLKKNIIMFMNHIYKNPEFDEAAKEECNKLETFLLENFTDRKRFVLYKGHYIYFFQDGKAVDIISNTITC
jgi:hypothetical protein